MHGFRLFERAAGYGEAVAIHTDGCVTSYSQLLDDSARVASALLESSIDLLEDRVAFLAPPGPDYVSTQWGVWRAGGVAVPLSLGAAEKELAYTVSDSGVKVVVASAAYAEHAQSLCTQAGARLVPYENTSQSTVRELPKVERTRRAMILYTSGTTSKPKGVVTTFDGLEAQIESLVEAWRWQSSDTTPLFLPLHHVHGIVNVLLCALWSGACVDAFPRFDAQQILRSVAEGAYSVFMAVPTVYVKLIQVLQDLSPDERERVVAEFRDMRLMVSGSAALPASVHNHWRELTGQALLERYGMTEIGMALSNPYDGERRPGAVGLPLPGVDVRLVAEDGTVAAAEGVQGEIQVRGRTVFGEYWNRPEATREAFREGWFCTGDIAVREEGYYRILGRSSVDIIKSGGYKLSALEIEASLLDHPSIKECAVVGLADDTWGEVVAAALVAEDGPDIDPEEVRAWCQGVMSAYKVPRRFLITEQLPRNVMGKITKPAVSALFTASEG
ncbi:MAG: acyl-CoA synthetase [Planctomycetota bacterium]